MRRIGVLLAVGLAAIGAYPSIASAKGGRADRKAAEHALKRVKDLKQGIGVRTGRELTPALADLAARRGDLDRAEAKEATALLARPTDGNGDQFGDGYSVSEATPVCDAQFCVHYVTTTGDAPSLADGPDSGSIPDYVDEMLDAFHATVYPTENIALGWPDAVNDGTRGGDSGKIDVYLKDVGSQGFYGYAAPDPGQSGSSRFAYLVMDNDFSPAQFPGYADPLLPLEVTAAHEYNHVLQFGIDTFEDTWMFESTATYMEDEVYPAINDYLQYLNPWVSLGTQPITAFPVDGAGDPLASSIKVYGSAVWNHFLASRYGGPTILAAWQAKTQVNGGSFAPASYGTAIAAHGGTGFSDAFDDFSAAVAEWKAPGSPFPDATSYPDFPSRPTLNVNGAPTTATLNHTTFALRNVPVPISATSLTLRASLPAGLKGAVALVGRTGTSTTGGTVTTQIQRLSSGGTGSVTLPNANTFGRITAVLVNSDPTQTGFGTFDWNFSRDSQQFTGVQVLDDNAPPAPAATTGSSSDAGNGAVTLNGTVNPNGVATTYYFQYGTTPAYGSTVPVVPASAGSGTGDVPATATLSGVFPGTYHYRLIAVSAGGTTAGGDMTVQVAGTPPIVATAAPTELSANSAVLNGTVDARGLSTSYIFEYGTSLAYGSKAPGDAGGGRGAVGVSARLADLKPSTVYHYRLLATNASGTAISPDATFTTPAVAGTAVPKANGTGIRALVVSAQLLPVKLRVALRKGLRVRAGCGETCTLRVGILIPAALAKKLHSTRLVARAVVRAGKSPRVVTLHMTRKARRLLARLRSVKVTLTVSASTSDGRAVTKKKTVTLRR